MPGEFALKVGLALDDGYEHVEPRMNNAPGYKENTCILFFNLILKKSQKLFAICFFEKKSKNVLVNEQF